MKKKFPITKKGYERLTREIHHIKYHERPAIIEAIATAREHGDFKENAEYKAAKEKQNFLESKLMRLEDKKMHSEIIDFSKLSGKIIKFGATVKLADLDTDSERIYHVVGEYEANIAKQLISISAPIARALIGKEEGDIVEVITPKGRKEYEILEVLYTHFDI